MDQRIGLLATSLDINEGFTEVYVLNHYSIAVHPCFGSSTWKVRPSMRSGKALPLMFCFTMYSLSCSVTTCIWLRSNIQLQSYGRFALLWEPYTHILTSCCVSYLFSVANATRGYGVNGPFVNKYTNIYQYPTTTLSNGFLTLPLAASDSCIVKLLRLLHAPSGLFAFSLFKPKNNVYLRNSLDWASTGWNVYLVSQHKALFTIMNRMGTKFSIARSVFTWNRDLTWFFCEKSYHYPHDWLQQA